MSTSVEFFGETFQLTGEVSEFALMEFAEAASDGVDGDTMAGMASMLRLIMDCILEPEPHVEVGADGVETTVPPVSSERSRFRAVARKNRASSVDLVKVLDAAFAQATGRPTGRSSDSSDGPQSTPLRSVSPSVGSGTAPSSGRPDLDLMQLRMAQAASA